MSYGRPWVVRTRYGNVASTFADRRQAQAFLDNMNRRSGGGYTLSYEG
tara:strand:- start:361 stop:504 length:144 start_codon:yes stop_codon:yes gene_type:complete